MNQPENIINVRQIIRDVFESIDDAEKDELTVDEIMNEPPEGFENYNYFNIFK